MGVRDGVNKAVTESLKTGGNKRCLHVYYCTYLMHGGWLPVRSSLVVTLGASPYKVEFAKSLAAPVPCLINDWPCGDTYTAVPP